MILCISTAVITENIKNQSTVISFKSYSWGSSGDIVKQIQQRLIRWGYMNGTADGVYGVKTWNGVRSFQSKNGLKVDGVVGTATLQKLGINTVYAQASKSTNSYENNVRLLAAAIHGESRGEPYEGQVAVGAVIINRTRHPSFPNSIAGVIYQPGAFDAVKDGQINMTPDNSALNAARDALNGWDPSDGCIYYWNPATATSKWIWSIPVYKTIGKHVFGKK
jgi:N-acetylmuramoyl-L-alanine amidase